MLRCRRALARSQRFDAAAMSLRCLRDALPMLRRCKPLRARITLARVRRWCRVATGAGVVEHRARCRACVPGRVCKACRARTGDARRARVEACRRTARRASIAPWCIARKAFVHAAFRKVRGRAAELFAVVARMLRGLSSLRARVCKSCGARSQRSGIAQRARARVVGLDTGMRATRFDVVGNVFVTTRVRTSWSDACRQVFLHFFLNIIVQTNYDSP